MEENLQCPVCLISIHPSKFKPYGLCLTGHMTCGDCATAILNGNARGNCPKCRRRGFELSNHNVLANYRLEYLLTVTPLTCQFCSVETPGNELLVHEGRCTLKTTQCPLCEERCTYQTFATLGHHCITKARVSLNQNTWHILVSFDELKLVRDGLDISPIMLVSQDDTSEFQSRAYVRFVRENDINLGIKVIWMEDKQFVTKSISDLKVQVFAKVLTEAGFLQTAYSSGLYFSPHVGVDREFTSLDIDFKRLDIWQKYAINYTCDDCRLVANAHTHFHLTIKFQPEFDIEPFYVWE